MVHWNSSTGTAMHSSQAASREMDLRSQHLLWSQSISHRQHGELQTFFYILLVYLCSDEKFMGLYQVSSLDILQFVVSEQSLENAKQRYQSVNQ